MNNRYCRRFTAAWIPYLAVLVLFFPLSSEGQALNLHDAITGTINNYPLLKQREAEINAGRAHITTVNGNRLPSLILQDQFDMGTDNSVQGSYFSLGMIPSTPGSYINPQYNPYMGNTAISFLQWEFLTFGYYNAQTMEAKAQLAVHEANMSSDKYQLTINTISLYLDWLNKYRLLQIQNENVQRAEVVLTAIRANVLSGLKPGVDSSTASATYADARIGYLQALDNYNYDRIALQTYTGIRVENMIPDTVLVSEAIPGDAAAVPLQDSIAEQHPLLATYQKQYEQQLATNTATSKKYLPRLGLDGAAWDRSSSISQGAVYPDNLSTGMVNSRYNYLMGLTLTYNLFDLKHRHDELAEGKFQAQALQNAVQTQQVSLNGMLRQANTNYLTTIEKLKALPIELSSARQAYGQQLALYKSGLNTLIDVSNAQYVLLQAETNYVITQSDLLKLIYIRAGVEGQLDNFLLNLKK